MLSSCQVIFLSGRLPVRSSSCHVFFLSGCLPVMLSSFQVVCLSGSHPQIIALVWSSICMVPFKTNFKAYQDFSGGVTKLERKTKSWRSSKYSMHFSLISFMADDDWSIVTLSLELKEVYFFHWNSQLTPFWTLLFLGCCPRWGCSPPNSGRSSPSNPAGQSGSQQRCHCWILLSC